MTTVFLENNRLSRREWNPYPPEYKEIILTAPKPYSGSNAVSNEGVSPEPRLFVQFLRITMSKDTYGSVTFPSWEVPGN
jgi:hypothetical protein